MPPRLSAVSRMQSCGMGFPSAIEHSRGPSHKTRHHASERVNARWCAYSPAIFSAGSGGRLNFAVVFQGRTMPRASATFAGSIFAVMKPSMFSACASAPRPGSNDQRVAIGLAAFGMLARLGSGKDEGARFNGARAKQHMPMGLAVSRVKAEGTLGDSIPPGPTSDRGRRSACRSRMVRPSRPHGRNAAVTAWRPGRKVAGIHDSSPCRWTIEHVDLVIARGDLALR